MLKMKSWDERLIPDGMGAVKTAETQPPQSLGRFADRYGVHRDVLNQITAPSHPVCVLRAAGLPPRLLGRVDFVA